MLKSECFGFFGPNGAGKTTTMKILYGKACLHRIKTRYRRFGLIPAGSPCHKGPVGSGPQEDNLDAELNVSDNLLIYAAFMELPGVKHVCALISCWSLWN
jgi:lipooligosaccharide transport system ATP-binding protein